MDLKVDKLRVEPLANARVGFSCRRVKVKEHSFQILLLDQNLVSLNAERISGNVENLRPEHSFEL